MIVSNVKDLQQVSDFIARSSELGFDEETTGLNTRKNKVIGFSISDGNTSYYIAHLSWDGEKLVELIPKAACESLLRELLSFNVKLITWNGAFDLNFCYHYFGIDLLPLLFSDGMLSCHTINEDGPFALKKQAALILGESETEEQQALKDNLKKNNAGPKEFYKADLDVMGKYGAKDPEITIKLDRHFRSQMDDSLRDFYFSEVMALYREVTIPMERNGIPVDVDLIRKTDFEISNKLKELEVQILETMSPQLGQFNKKYLNKMYPPKTGGKFAQTVAQLLNVDLPKTKSGALSFSKKAMETLPSWHLFRQFIEGKSELPTHLIYEAQKQLNGGEPKLELTSKDQLRYVFFSILKERPTSFTDRGVPQVNSTFLEGIKHKYDFGPKLLEFNKLFKLKSSYIDRFLEKQEDGVFYPSFQQHRTTSGRYGGDLQQLPRALEPEDEPSETVRHYTNLIRRFFIAGEGHLLIDADYNSLEVMVFADDAGDDALLEMANKDFDFYSSTAIEVHNLHDKYSADKSAANYLKLHKPKLRQDAKVYGLGIRYGMGDWKLSKTLDISMGQAESIISDYFKSYPKLKQKMDYYLNEAKTKGRIVSKAGRVRHLPKAKFYYENYGDDILDVRNIYKKYAPEDQDEVKKIRKRYNNLLNNALNFPIQSLAASIVNRASIKLALKMREMGLKAYICMNVHDEICVRAPEEEVEKITPIMRDIMENTTKLSAPLTAKPEVAYTYGDVK